MPAQTLAQQINEFRGPQPADCLAVNTQRLVDALKSSGPVVHLRQVVSLDAEGKPKFEDRSYTKIAAVTTTDEEGNEHTTPEREPTDKELAGQWNLPTAASMSLNPAPTTTTKE